MPLQPWREKEVTAHPEQPLCRFETQRFQSSGNKVIERRCDAVPDEQASSRWSCRRCLRKNSSCLPAHFGRRAAAVAARPMSGDAPAALPADAAKVRSRPRLTRHAIVHQPNVPCCVPQGGHRRHRACRWRHSTHSMRRCRLLRASPPLVTRIALQAPSCLAT